MKRPQNIQDQYQKRMNHQNNADLLLSVYELTARSSLQLANQKQRHQSQGRHFAQQYDLKGGSPDVNIMTSPKKNGVTQALSPHSSISKPPVSVQPQLIQSGSIVASRRQNKHPQIQLKHQASSNTISSPRYQPSSVLSSTVNLQEYTQNRSAIAIIRSFINCTSDLIDTTQDLRQYRFAKLNIENLTQRLENNEVQFNIDNMQSALSAQLEKFKIENESLRKKISDSQDDAKTSTNNSQVSTFNTQLQQLNEQLSKIEKKAASRKVCIKKLYQLLEKNERELELYRTGKKGSNKNSFIQESAKQNQILAQKKNELNEILNTVYVRKNKETSYESMLLNFIQSVDPRTFDLIKTKTPLNNSQESNQLDENGDTDKYSVLHQSLKTIKQEIYQKRDCEQALQNSLQYTLRMIEANQQIWRQAIDEEHVDSMTFEPYIKFMTALGFTKMAQEMVELEKIQAKIQIDTIQWIERKSLVQRKMDQLIQELEFIDSENPIEAVKSYNLESQTKLISLQKQLEELESKSALHQKEKLLLIKEHEGNQNILKDQFQSLKNTYEEKLKHSNEQITQLQNELEWEKQEVYRLQQKIDLQNDMILKYEDQFQIINNGQRENLIIQDQEKSILTQEIESLKQQLIEKEESFMNYRKQFVLSNLEVFSAQIITNFEKKIINLKQSYQIKIEEISKVLIKIQAKLQHTQAESQDLKLFQKENMKLSTLLLVQKQQIESSEQDKKSLQLMIQQLQSEFHQQQSDLEKTLDNNNILQALQKQEKQKQQAEIQNLEQKLKQEVQRYQEEIIQKEQLIQSFQQQLQNNQVQQDNLKQEINDLSLTIKNLKSQEIEIKNLQLSFEQKEKCFEEEIQRLQLSMNEISQSSSQKIDTQMKEINLLELQIVDLTSQLEQKQILFLQSEKYLSEQKYKLDQLNNQLKQKTNELNSLSQESQEKYKTLEDQIVKNQALSIEEQNKLKISNQNAITEIYEQNKQKFSEYENIIQNLEKKSLEEKNIKIQVQQKHEELFLKFKDIEKELNSKNKQSSELEKKISELKQSKEQESKITKATNDQLEQNLQRIQKSLEIQQQKSQAEICNYQEQLAQFQVKEKKFLETELVNLNKILQLEQIIQIQKQQIQEAKSEALANEVEFREKENQLLQQFQIEFNQKDEQFAHKYDSLQKDHQIQILSLEKELDILIEIIENNSAELMKMKKQVALLTNNQIFLKNSLEGTSERLIVSHIEFESLEKETLRSYFDESEELCEFLAKTTKEILKEISASKYPVNQRSEVNNYILLGQILQEKLEESTDRETQTLNKYQDIISILQGSILDYSKSKQTLEQLCSILMNDIIMKETEVNENEDLVRILHSLSNVIEENRIIKFQNEQSKLLEIQQHQNFSNMKQEILELKFQIEQTQSQKSELQQLMSEYQKELLTSTQELDQLKNTMSRYQHKIDEIQSLEANIISLQGQINSLNKLNNELKQTIEQQNKQITEQKPITVYCQALENLFNELLYNRVNLTSMKQYLNEQQREKLNDFRKKVGEIQIKLISSDKVQKALDDCKFNLTQYQQIVDKSEMRARHFENECQKRDEEIRELKNHFDHGKKQNSAVQEPQNSNILSDEILENFEQDVYGPTDNFLNFSLREEVLYGDKSFFDELSLIITPKPHNLQQEVRLLKNQLQMVEEDLLGMHLRFQEKK